MATTFSEKGEAALKTCDPRLQRIARIAKEWLAPFMEFDITNEGGARTVERQQALFDAGKSKVNPKAFATPEELYKSAKHVTGPGAPLSRAYDIHIVSKQPGGAYDKHAMCFVASAMMIAARSIGVKLRWGGDFDRDNAILEPGTFHDLPHFELD